MREINIRDTRLDALGLTACEAKLQDSVSLNSRPCLHTRHHDRAFMVCLTADGMRIMTRLTYTRLI